ncbi:GH3 auxin-responsive promoter family protein, partial [Candidatus Bathyarchaeota archaeon]|nr:GH3 auxin-responsive promoter family protein [Candidatus Bathyarchaeota archaeon]
MPRMDSSEEGLRIFQSILSPWYKSLEDPQETQRQVLQDLIRGYEKTLYGKRHNASEIEGEADFRAHFPIVNYRELNPYLAEVREGNYSAFLSEPLLCWVMTRGSTGVAKVLPATKTHLEHI